MAALPGMAAVIGLAPEQVEHLIARWNIADLYAANFNSPRQTVVSGTADALAEGGVRFSEAGARRVLPLPVAGPFHCPLMADAAETFRPALEKTAFLEPGLPLYSNVSGGRVSSGAEAKRLALAQITSPVRWTDEEQSVQVSGGFDACLEAGPGKALGGFWKDSGSAIPCLAAGTAADIDKLLNG
jgi:[acyl-carrier-protein] S-malonyltransferase